MKNKSGNKVLLLILIAGLFFKLIYIFNINNLIVTFGDASDYNAAAMSLLNEHRFPTSSSMPFFRAPFYPFFLSFLYIFSPQNYLMVKIVQVFLITITAYVLFKIAAIFLPVRIALVAAAIFSLHPYFLLITTDLQTEPLFLFLTCISIYFLLKFRELKNRFEILFLSGLAIGCAILTRPVFIIFISLAMLWIFKIKAGFRFFLKASFILLFACCLILTPWIIRNRILFKDFIFCNDAGGYNFFIANSRENYERLTTKDKSRFDYLNFKGLYVDKTRKQIALFEEKNSYSKLTPKSKEGLWYMAGFSYIKNNKFQWFKLLLLKSWEYLRPYLHPMCYGRKEVVGSFFINTAIFLLGIAGLWSAFKDKKIRDYVLFFILYFVVFLIAHAVYISANRFRIVFMDPYMYIFASYAVVKLIENKKRVE